MLTFFKKRKSKEVQETVPIVKQVKVKEITLNYGKVQIDKLKNEEVPFKDANFYAMSMNGEIDRM